MGYRYRKSFKIGPFRITFSKSGISYSFGWKGMRVTKRADGKTQTTVSVPGTGVSHVSTARGRQTDAPEHPPEEKPVKYTGVTFYLENTQLKNPDGQKRQDILYQFKMRRPPFEHEARAELLNDDQTPEAVQLALNGSVVGEVPPKEAATLCAEWERVAGVRRVEVKGRRGTYDAYVVVLLRDE